ncbi:MAG: IPT/TIG domain-containing protein [Candidatus Kapaibacteriota bacterium]
MTGAAAVSLASTGAMTSNGAFNLNGGAFGVGVSALTLNGAINFGAGTLSSPVNFGTLRVLGTGAITGQMNNLSPGYALVEMNRMNATLSLASGSSLVTNTLLLTNGIIQTNNTADIVSVTNTLTALGSATTYISGKLRRALLPAVLNNAGTFDFPIGKGGLYLPMRFQNVTANSAVVQAEAFNIGSGGMPGSAFATISSSEYWQTSLQGGAFTSGLVSLSRPTPMLPSSSVVGHSATQTGSYNGLGGAVSPPSVLSFSPVLSANRFFALGTLPNAFYYNSGAAQTPANWNSEENGTGAPAIDFLTPGTSFIVPTGRNALFTAAATFVPGIFVTVNGGGTLTVRTGSDTLAVNGIMRVSNGGTLAIADSSRFIAPSGVFYLGQTAQLFYDTPANRTATSNEFPATMLGSVRVSNGRLRLETTASVRNITIQGSLTLQNSTLDFGKDSTRLRLEGAISFNPSQFATNLTHGLTIAGSGSITGAINFSTKSLGWLTMQRTGLAMTLGDSLTIGSQLSLFGGNIVPSLLGIVRLTNSADTALLGGSFSSFIGGTLARALPTNLTPVDARSHFYPIGKGSTYLPLTLMNATTGSVSPIVAAEAFAVGAGGGVALGVNGALSSSEHWRVEPLSGNFGGAQVGVIRPNPPFAADNKLVVSNIKTGLYNGLGGALLPIAQGTSLVGDAAQISGERFFAAVGPTLSGPSITGFSPSIGGEQTVMTITGTNLTGVNAIAIGGINVAGFQVLSSTTISVQIGTVGSGPIQIGSPSGGAASGSNFTFIPAPRIFGALPNPAGLGVPVTISGANFTGANFLSIGGVQIPPTGFTVDMAGNTITTTIPLNAANQIVTIATLGGTAISTNALVLIPPPQIMSINPPLASTGQTITLFGQNFIGVQTVRFGSSTAQFTVNSPTRITLIVPARESTSATQVPISVRTGSGIATSATLFAYNPLPNGTPNGLDPVRIVVISEVRDKITTLGGRVRVTGANLELIQQIKLITSIGSTNASWLISSSAAITLIIPTTGLLSGTNATLSSAATSMDVLGVYNRVVVNDAFRVINVPRILSVTPPDAAGGEEITLTGTAMDLITSITIGGTAATFRIIDSSRVVVRVPFSFSPDSVRIPASGALAVQSVGGGASTAATIINAALAGGQPIITSFSPTNAVPGGEVIITGLNLTAVQDIEVGGIPVASFVINSSNRITAILSTAASRSAQGIISLRTVFGVVNSRTALVFPSSLEGDTNAANALIALLGGDSRRLQFETQNNRITALRLSNAGLRGPIPPVISTLTELRELDLSNNLLDGQLPTTLATLRKLEVLNLSNNRFSGVLTPGIICQYRNLRFMDVSRNNLTGEIPVCITELDKIETLNLSFNRFTSLLPWQLGAMVNLRELRVSNNMLTGALPPEIGTGGARVTAKAARMTRTPTVEVIDVSNNAFTGGIPEEWGNIPMLRELRAENCGLTGSLPETILRWQGINILRLAKNRLSGEIPSFFAENLKEFSIDNNRFTGALPPSFAKATGLQVLSALGNRLTRIPNLAPLGRLVSSRLDTVLLDSNQLEFSSLEAFTRVKSFSASGQDLPKASDDFLATVGDILEISSAIGGTATRYQWFKNGNSLRGATAATLVLSNIQVQDVGTYFCRATNTLVSNLRLQTAPVRVSVTGAAQSVPAPRLIFPSAASTNIAPRPSFRWQASAGADSYTLVVARDVALRTDVQSVSISSPEQGDSIVLAFARSAGRGTLLERGVQYFWSVRASSQLPDLLASWSDTLSFRVAPFGQDIAFSSVNLGRVTIGDSARASGTIVNIGEDDVTVESAQVESGMANVFALNFTRTRLAKDATATFDVLFKPDRADTIRANVTVAYSDARGQGMRSVSIERALTGRGGAMFIEPLSFDSVRVGKTVLKILRVSNRSNQPQTLRAVRMLTARGNTTDSTFVIVDGDANSNRVIGAGESAFVQVRCATRTGGFKLGVVEADAGNDRVQGDIRAYSRLVRPDDAAVSFVAQASPKEAAPGAAVRVDVVINDYSPALAQRLLGAAQPEVRLAVRFDRQVLVLDNAADGGSRLQRGTSDTNVVIINARWDGRSRAVASMLCRAVAGSRTVTNLEIINAEWGSTSATVRPDWERRVFVEEPPKDIAAAGTFTALVSNAGGKRLITSVDTSRKPTLSLVRPNPANDVVSLTYKLMENSAPVSLDVLNMRGEVVQSLFAGISQTEGEYSLTVNVRGLPVGSYMLRLRANQDMVTQRLDVMR